MTKEAGRPGHGAAKSKRPSAEELRTTPTKVLVAKYGISRVYVKNLKESLGIVMTPEARRQAYDQRDMGAAPGENQPLPPKTLAAVIAQLEADGYQITKALPHEPVVELKIKPGQHYRCAVVCCTHAGNVFEQRTYLHDFYQYAQAQGVEEFWHAGDLTDGPDSMHPAMRHEHWIHTFDRAVDYVVADYPQGNTRLILGNHDEAWLKDPSGSDIGRAIAQRRSDIAYVGRRAADIRLGPVRIYIMHGAGGGAYARSYKLQKAIEGFEPEKRPDLLLMGNYHVAGHIPNYIGTEGFLLPCFEDQTPFLTGLGKSPVIGGLILDIEVGQRGLRDLRTEWRIYRQPRKGDYPKG
jgi:hypothetical protein